MMIITQKNAATGETPKENINYILPNWTAGRLVCQENIL